MHHQWSTLPVAKSLSILVPEVFPDSTRQHPLQQMVLMIGKRLSKGLLGTSVWTTGQARSIYLFLRHVLSVRYSR